MEEPMNSNSDQTIIGTSLPFRAVLEEVAIAGPADCAVLLQGETGTGKEVVAKAIHGASSRKAGPFVKVNCAAIPAGLLESELFGHDRGAFTGAFTQTTGRFQLAQRGTLFLDEIGDLPLELQPKLLRAIQEREFERLGSSQTIRVDARIIAATNQDLEQMVLDRRFRSDLFYRLNVFPIDLPPLRERKQDIPSLVMHFVNKFAQRMNKSIEIVPNEVMEVLVRHSWPGNIRELQNFIERAVLLTDTQTLRAPIADLKSLTSRSAVPDTQTHAGVERAYMLEALRKANWTVGGRHGAAARVGLPRTTFIARMRKYGLSAEPRGNETIPPATRPSKPSQDHRSRPAGPEFVPFGGSRALAIALGEAD
jgi:formate hydrogenlyase transcriptional activator